MIVMASETVAVIVLVMLVMLMVVCCHHHSTNFDISGRPNQAQFLHMRVFGYQQSALILKD